MQQYNLITIEGNTGAGKTSFASLLAEDFSAKLVLEEYVENPFLPKFYAEPERYAFSTEVYFLLDRHKQLLDMMDGNKMKKGLTITDYLLNKTLLYAQVNLSDDEYKLFSRLFHTLYPDLPQSELVIYIHSTVDRLIQNIKKRGRDFEQVVRREYLQNVEDLYLSYFDKNPELTVLIVHCDELDFVANNDHYQKIKEAITQSYKPGVHQIKIQV